MLASLRAKAQLYEAAHHYQRTHAAMQHEFDHLDPQVRAALMNDPENAPIPALLKDATNETGLAWDRFKRCYSTLYTEGKPYEWYQEWEHQGTMKAIWDAIGYSGMYLATDPEQQ